MLETTKKKSDIGPPRKFFTLNDAGREELKKFWSKWGFISTKINELEEKKLCDYQKAWEEINANLLMYRDFTDRNLMQIFNGVLDMLEDEELSKDIAAIDET